VFGPERRAERPRVKPLFVQRSLTLEKVHAILTDRRHTDAELAAQMGVSRQAVSQVRLGRSWSNVYPELPRRGDWISCVNCKHWRHDECDLGFPDPIEEGPAFASDCDLYEV
jgi:hypothetical protein